MTGHIYPRPSVRHPDGWAILLLGLPGGLRREVRFHGTRAEAELKLAALLTDAARGSYVQASASTVQEFFEAWLENQVKPTVRFNTYIAYRNVIRQLVASPLGGLRMTRLTSDDLIAYFKRQGLRLQPGTLQMHKAMLSTAFRFAVKKKLLTENLVSDVRIPRQRRTSSRSTMKTLTMDQAQRVLVVVADTGSPQTSAFFATALDTGMRLGELLAGCGKSEWPRDRQIDQVVLRCSRGSQGSDEHARTRRADRAHV